MRRLFGSVRWLRGYLRDHGIRLVHTTMGHYHTFAWLAARRIGVKTVWFNHGPCPRGYWKGVQHAFPADATVVGCHFMESCHRGLTLAPPPHLIAYGLEEKWFRPQPVLRAEQRHAWGLAPDEVAVGMLGRIERWKRQHLFLDAIAALPANVVGRCRFFIGGAAMLGVGNEYAEELERRRRQHPNQDRITFTGFVDAEAFWEAMDIAVHCSEAEPFGYVVLEAMAKGKLVIAANTGGVPEVITDGVDGFLADPSNTPGLAARIIDCVRQSHELNGIRSRARAVIVDRYNVGQLVNRFESLYDELLGARSEADPSVLQRKVPLVRMAEKAM
jgi:glycosyltransferase involved in cell wall biosynthesis